MEFFFRTNYFARVIEDLISANEPINIAWPRLYYWLIKFAQLFLLQVDSFVLSSCIFLGTKFWLNRILSPLASETFGSGFHAHSVESNQQLLKIFLHLHRHVSRIFLLSILTDIFEKCLDLKWLQQIKKPVQQTC